MENLTLFNPLNYNFIREGIDKGLFELGENCVYYTQSENRKQKLTKNDPEELIRLETYFDLINKYKYEPGCIGIEVSIMVGSEKKHADIIVYTTLNKKEDEVFLVVECKKDEINDNEFEIAVKQCNSYARSQGAQYSITVSGKTIEVIKAKKNTKNYDELKELTVGDIPVAYGVPTEWRYFKGDNSRDIRPIEKLSLMKIFKKCNNTLWDGGQLNPLEAFDELSKLIFAKISDELKGRKTGEPYDFQVKSNEDPEATFERIKNVYFTGLDRDEDVFKEPIKITPRKLVVVVKHLEAISLNKTDLDSKGVAFESFMQDFFVGKAGQYFTPRQIIEFMVDFIEIDNNSKILDPACGSSGFLLHALEKVRRQANDYYPTPEEKDDNFRHWHNFASNNLFGIEINRSLARVSKMNMIIHNDGHTNVIAQDSLESIEIIKTSNPKFDFNTFDVILSNPPFGASVSSSEKNYVENYELGKNGSKKRANQKTEILFIERIWQFLKPDTGVAGIILPDGILTNSSLQYVRDFVLDKFKLLAVVSIPQTAFSHYGAGVKCSVLFVQKWGEKTKLEKQSDYPVFMAKADNIGYDATGRRTGKNDLKDLKAKYKEFQKDAKAFFV